MKCLLADSEGLSAEIENLGDLGPEELDQTWSRRTFKAAGTPIRPFTESTVLIRHGLYRWSRNPMYLGAVLLVAGVAILLGSLAPMVVVIAFFAILQETVSAIIAVLEDCSAERR